ncbi:substrate-binding domain-containing protein [Streptomyces sp. NPDC002588]|uniref:substrate-binding domain-containing protein n=1 Tax=Streptomyces sp. NPDC002588 TaxID=3154419 RepID=UPI00331CBD0E
MPTVVIGRHGSSPVYDTVADDDIEGAALVVAHLVGFGHRRIAHIEHHETDPTRLMEMPNARRAKGYRMAMRAHGPAERIDVVSTSYTQEGGYRGTQELLPCTAPTRPTAVFAGADIVAMGVLEAVAEAGRPFPATSRWRATTTPRSPRSAPDLPDQRGPGWPRDGQERRTPPPGADHRSWPAVGQGHPLAATKPRHDCRSEVSTPSLARGVQPFG